VLENLTLAGMLAFLAHASIILGLGLRIISRRLSVGTSLAWLTLIIVAPLLGGLLYLLIGENRLGRTRAERAEELRARFDPFARVGEGDAAPAGDRAEAPIQRLVRNTGGYPALAGNSLELFSDAESILRAIIRDVDGARSTCHLEFYIWNPGGTADEVGEALLRAAGRGVACRVLLDSVGSADFFRSPWPRRLKAGGVRLVQALPVGLLRALFERLDLRLHRKIVVVDGETAYTGSLNLVDPRYFKQGAGVGQWVDCMVRVKGPAVGALQSVFMGDWVVETGEILYEQPGPGLLVPLERAGPAVVQAAPSDPALGSREILRLLLMTVYSARRELVLTTPYFVPEESLLVALVTAAQRGVSVTIVLPAEVDSFLVRHASRSYFGELAEAGVRILCFRGGLLHSKTVTVDGELALIGTVNLDVRSFRLNFEVTLFAYDPGFCAQLRALQASYEAESSPVQREPWWRRSRPARLLDDSVRLVGPLL
jgi:cardiolipin synthase